MADTDALTREPCSYAERPVPAWLAEFDGMCLPCSDAEFYGHRALHAKCEHGDCTCGYGSR